jgi:hypothetical protein
MTRLSFSSQISLCLPSKYISFYSKHLSSSSSSTDLAFYSYNYVCLNCICIFPLSFSWHRLLLILLLNIYLPLASLFYSSERCGLIFFTNCFFNFTNFTSISQIVVENMCSSHSFNKVMFLCQIHCLLEPGQYNT